MSIRDIFGNRPPAREDQLSEAPATAPVNDEASATHTVLPDPYLRRLGARAVDPLAAHAFAAGGAGGAAQFFRPQQ